MAKTRIRRAVTGDFSTLLKIDQASFPSSIAYDSLELSYFMNRRGAETLIMEEDGAIVGFLIMQVRPNANTATIVTLDIQEAFRRRGFAARLLEESEEILRLQSVLRYDLQVDVDNLTAIAFYKKHGFESVRRLKEYYPNGQDAYLMVKMLQPSDDK